MRYFVFIFIFFLLSCSAEKQSELVIYGNNIYTLDNKNSKVEAIYIKNGIIEMIGTKESIAETVVNSNTKILNVGNACVIPGIIEGHGHFSGMGYGLQNLNFLESKSWQEIVSQVKEKVGKAEKGEWIYGRGWHQDKWDRAPNTSEGTYPTHESLSEISPDNPTILYHASGHSLFANKKAMEIAGISAETPDPGGGHIVRDQQGNAIGVFEERAMNSIRKAYDDYLSTLSEEELMTRWDESMDLAMEECVSNGITSFQDAGSKFYELDRYKKMAESGKLRMRLWAMLRHSSDEMEGKVKDYRTINAGDGFFTCRAIKTELDGALGSYGAWLLEPYEDKANFTGQNTTSTEEVQRIALLARNNNMQLCVHAIGDRANNETLKIIYNTVRKEEDRRWRIEHAQHVHPDDIEMFQLTGTIASFQAIHCTSDAPFVVDRLGEERAREGAYSWRKFIDAGIHIVNGTDVPVEDISPIDNFYAAVTRKRPDNKIPFFPEQSMTRLEALKSMTIDAAYAAFEENEKGSIEVGKYGDLTILDTDLLKCNELSILDTKVLYTIVGGKIEFKRDEQ